jgi:hypothetical protein
MMWVEKITVFLLPQLLDELADIGQLVGVQSRGRLIEDEHGWVVHHRLGQTYPLAVAFRQGADGLVLLALQAGQGDHLGDALPRLAQLVQPRYEAEILAHVHILIQRVVLGQVTDLAPHLHRLLGHIVAAYADTAAGLGDEAGDDLHRRGLSRPIGAQEAQHLPGPRLEGDLVHGLLSVVYFGQVLYLDGHRVSFLPRKTNQFIGSHPGIVCG